ncbi:MAG: hypothetical protein JSR72_17195 [Proteobacteria bacterium]|nr:hypothetical protein [Pseudomonadota bacterium]
MVALTYREAPAVTATSGATAKTVPASDVQAAPKGFFARFIAAMMEARLKQAEREIRLYGRSSSKNDTPFGGW